MRKGRCYWCGRAGDLNGEHASLPSWAVVIIRASHPPGSEPKIYNQKANRWHDDLDFKLYDVCPGCNGGWLSDLDGYAQSVLSDFMARDFVNGVVEIEADVRLARWAAKTFANRARAGVMPLPDQKLRAFCMGQGPTDWAEWPFRILVSFGQVLIEGRAMPTYHVAAPATTLDAVYRCFSIGGYHFHFVWDPTAPPRQLVIRKTAETLARIRGAGAGPLDRDADPGLCR